MASHDDTRPDPLSRIAIAACPPVLVTSGAGYIGSHAALALLDLGIKVVVLSDIAVANGGPVPYQFAARRAGDPAGLVADASAAAALGWTPLYADIGTIVAHALAWERLRLKRPVAFAA